MAELTMTPVAHHVIGRVDESADTVSLVVGATERTRDALPGQFHMLWAPGVGEIPISVSRIGADGPTFTIRAVGAVTRALCATRRGDTMWLRGPFGTHWDLGSAVGSDLVFVAGGLGLAPLRPAVEAVLAAPDRYRSVSVLVGARTPAAMLFPHDLARWATAVEVRRSVDVSTGGWDGTVGPVTALLAGLLDDPSSCHLAVCGPEMMMRVVGDVVEAADVPADNVQVSLERTMQCGVGHCGHCQLGEMLVCVDGPVTTWSRVAADLRVAQR